MTFEDVENGNMTTSRDINIGSTVAAVLQRAQVENRLTCGMLPAIKMLELDPASILFCILPQNHHDDTALHIHYVLMEAFCNENDIRMIKVDCAEKLANLLKDAKPEPNASVVSTKLAHLLNGVNNEPKPCAAAAKLANLLKKEPKSCPASSDCSCLLIHRLLSSDLDAKSEDELTSYCDEAEETSPQPVIELPIS